MPAGIWLLAKRLAGIGVDQLLAEAAKVAHGIGHCRRIGKRALALRRLSGPFVVGKVKELLFKYRTTDAGAEVVIYTEGHSG